MDHLTGQTVEGATPASNARQDELNQLIEHAFANSPNLKEALEIFQMGQAEYTRALIGMSSAKIVLSDNTNPIDNEGVIGSDVLD